MKKILLSFCGAQDPLTKIGDEGPILSLLTRMPDFHSMILLATHIRRDSFNLKYLRSQPTYIALYRGNSGI